MSSLWIDEPTVLIAKWYEIYPINYSELSYEDRINSIIRLLIILLILYIIITQQYAIIIYIMITIFIFMMCTTHRKKEEYNPNEYNLKHPKDYVENEMKKSLKHCSKHSRKKDQNIFKPMAMGVKRNMSKFFADNYERGVNKDMMQQRWESYSRENLLRDMRGAIKTTSY